MMNAILCAWALLVCAVAPVAADLGNQLKRAFNTYEDLPITAHDAVAAGWSPVAGSTCQLGLGIPYRRGPPRKHPLVLYFTPAGQFTGMGVYVFGQVPTNLVEQGFFLKSSTGLSSYFISVQTRPPSDTCSTTAIADSMMGDVLVINPNAANFTIPTLEMEARQANWHRARCIVNMGTHYMYDLASAPDMSWEAASFVPVVPMYESSKVSAIFFHVPLRQPGLYYVNDWDILPGVGHLPKFGSLMCLNFCGGECQYHETYSIMHLFFRDPAVLQCTVCNETCC